jgi:hypothetical protein
MQRLQAREIFETLGKSLDALGKEKDAVMAYQVFFARNPVMQYLKPKLYQRFLELKKSEEK